MSDCWEPTLLGALVVYEVISTDERVKSGDRQTVWEKRLLIKTHFIKFSLPPHIYSSASVSWCPTCSLSVQDTNAKASGWARIPEHPVRKKKHTLTSVAEVTGPHARTTQANATIFILMLVNQCLKIWFNQRWFNYQKANEIMQFAFAFYGVNREREGAGLVYLITSVCD